VGDDCKRGGTLCTLILYIMYIKYICTYVYKHITYIYIYGYTHLNIYASRLCDVRYCMLQYVTIIIERYNILFNDRIIQPSQGII